MPVMTHDDWWKAHSTEEQHGEEYLSAASRSAASLVVSDALHRKRPNSPASKLGWLRTEHLCGTSIGTNFLKFISSGVDRDRFRDTGGHLAMRLS